MSDLGEEALYNELWRACAGPLVTVPRVGERVFYFPQGHIEQVRNYYFYEFITNFLLLEISLYFEENHIL